MKAHPFIEWKLDERKPSKKNKKRRDNVALGADPYICVICSWDCVHPLHS